MYYYAETSNIWKYEKAHQVFVFFPLIFLFIQFIFSQLWHCNGSLDSKGIKPVHPKGNQLWIFTGRTDAEAEAPIVGPPDAKIQLIGKGPDAVKDWRQEEKGATEDEMVGWHHQLNSHEFKQTLVERGQRSLVCFSYGVTKSWTQLSNQTTNIIDLLMYFLLLDPRVCLYIPSI